DHEHVAAAEPVARGGPTRWVPAVIPCRQRPAPDARRFLQPLRCLARQRRAVDRITLRLPCLARGREHGGFAGTRETDDSGNLLRPGDVLDRPPLLVRKPRPAYTPIALAGGQLAAI